MKKHVEVDPSEVSHSKDPTSSSSSSLWSGMSWMKKMEDVAADVANRADALACERGWQSNTAVGTATSLLRQKSNNSSQSIGLISCLAPSFGPDFVNEWQNTNNYKIWYEQQRTRIEMKLNRINSNKSEEDHNVQDNNSIQIQQLDEDPPICFDQEEEAADSNNLQSSSSGTYLMTMMGSAASSLLFTNVDVTGNDCPSSGSSSFMYPNGDRYNGEWLNGQRHGQGICIYAGTGDKHDGMWVSDMPHGEGSFTTGSGDFIYDGDFNMGRRTGHGHAVWHSRRESYTGDFQDGDFHGSGVHCGHDGDVYQGEFVKGRRQGVGTLQKSNNKDNSTNNCQHEDSLHVVWTRQGVKSINNDDDEKNVKNKYTISTLSWIKYTGEWCDGVREGIGTCNYADDSSSYTGSWRGDQPFGEGEFKSGHDFNSYVYNGEWQYGLKHGEGKEEINVKEQISSKLMKFSREGRWERDEPIAGEWCLVWRNSQIIIDSLNKEDFTSNIVSISNHNRFDMNEAWYGEGDRSYVGFACGDGLAEGIGTMKYKNTGAVYSGEWLRGVRHGQGVCVYSDGSYHKGEWVDDAPVNRSLMFEDVNLSDEVWKSPETTATWPLGDDSKRKTPPLPQEDGHCILSPQLMTCISSENRQSSFLSSRSLSVTSSTNTAQCVTSSNYIHYFEFLDDDNKYRYRQISPDGLQELYGNWTNLEKVKKKELSYNDLSVYEHLSLYDDVNEQDDDLDKSSNNSIYNMFQIIPNNNDGISGICGYGRGVDALAGIVYEGEWLNGLPHGQGLITKTKPAARISVIVSNIEEQESYTSSIKDNQKRDSLIEWTYKGEFKFGKFSGLGIFEKKSLYNKSFEVTKSNLSSSIPSSSTSASISSSSSNIVAEALAATTTSQRINDGQNQQSQVLSSLIPTFDSRSVPWAKGVQFVSENTCNENKEEVEEKKVYDIIWQAMNISLSKSKWIKYSGEFHNGVMCGTGTATYLDGSEYSGNWKPLSDRSMNTTNSTSNLTNHEITNVGALGTTSLPRVLIGEDYLNSLPDGEGTWKSSSCETCYSGPWSFGVPHGVGEFIFKYSCDISHISNPLKSNKIKNNSKDVINHHEHQPIIVNRREEREGKWVKGSPVNGDWRFCFFDENSNSNLNSNKDHITKFSHILKRGQYVGNIIQGFPEGQGICKYPSGSLYNGSWNNQGLRNGIGSYVWDNGSSEYNGEWLNDEVCNGGKGSLRLPDGTVHTYEGSSNQEELPN